MKLIAPLLALALAGCASMPGGVTTSTSEFNQEKQISVKPARLYAGGLRVSTVKLGGFWSDQSPDRFHFTVAWLAGRSIERLRIRIDDEQLEFAASGYTRVELDDGPAGGDGVQTVRTFGAPLEVVRRMVAGREVIVRVESPDSFEEGRFSFDQQTYARPAFRKALAGIDSVR